VFKSERGAELFLDGIRYDKDVLFVGIAKHGDNFITPDSHQRLLVEADIFPFG